LPGLRHRLVVGRFGLIDRFKILESTDGHDRL
jgi:hypothetical protein